MLEEKMNSSGGTFRIYRYKMIPIEAYIADADLRRSSENVTRA